MRTEEQKRRHRRPEQKISPLAETQVCVARRRCDSQEIQRLGWLLDHFPQRNGAVAWRIGPWIYAEARSWQTAEGRLRRISDIEIQRLTDLPTRATPRIERKARRRTPGVIVVEVPGSPRGFYRVAR